MREFIRSLKALDDLIVRATLTFGFLALITLVAVFLDERVINGQNIWIKPFKFSVSMSLFLITMAWIIQYLPAVSRKRYSVAFVVFITVELAAIYLQAARGQASHHNFTTGYNIFVYITMGVAIGFATVLLIPLAVDIQLKTHRLPVSYVRSIQFGLLITILGSFVGVFMSVRGSHSVGGIDGAAGIPLLNWNTMIGDLRVAHFIGLHGLQVMIALGYLVSFRLSARLSKRAALFAVTAVFVILVAITVSAFINATRGLPFNFPLNHENQND